jgi:hypothetical protein
MINYIWSEWRHKNLLLSMGRSPASTVSEFDSFLHAAGILKLSLSHIRSHTRPSRNVCPQARIFDFLQRFLGEVWKKHPGTQVASIFIAAL